MSAIKYIKQTENKFRCVGCGHSNHAYNVGAINSFARFALGT